MKTYGEWREEMTSLAKELLVSGQKRFIEQGLILTELLKDEETAKGYYLREIEEEE